MHSSGINSHFLFHMTRESFVLNIDLVLASTGSRTPRLSIDDYSHDHSSILQDPTDAWQIDVFVAFLFSEP